jgi:hypothetical protein
MTAIIFIILLLRINSVSNHNNHDSLPNEEIVTNTFLILRKLYNQPTGILTIILALYLLLSLIVVSQMNPVHNLPPYF